MGKLGKIAAGDAAPKFDLASDSGKNVTLADFKGRSLVLYFYPRDNTPGCTREAQAFTKLASQLDKAGVDVVGVSRDSVASHGGFRTKYKLKIALASDPDLTAHKAYGAFGEKTSYGKTVQGAIRSTFLIGPEGRVRRVWSNVKVDGHAEAVLAESVDLATKLGRSNAKPERGRSKAKLKKK